MQPITATASVNMNLGKDITLRFRRPIKAKAKAIAPKVSTNEGMR